MSICCLCGQEIDSCPNSAAEGLSMDHVPPRQFYPKEIRSTNNLNLWVVPTHKRCNEDHRKDEEYVYHAMYGVVQKNNGPMGQTLLRDFARRTHNPQTPAMARSILKTFATVTERGVHLPPRVVQFSIDRYRAERVIIKIAQGLYYREHGAHIDRANCKDIRLCLEEADVPDFYSLLWQGSERIAVYPEVFSYRSFEFDDLYLLSMLFWESFMFCCAFENALKSRPTGPICVEDDKMQNQCVPLTKEEHFRLQGEFIRRELQLAFDQVDRGEVSDLDMKELLAEAHRRHAERQQRRE